MEAKQPKQVLPDIYLAAVAFPPSLTSHVIVVQQPDSPHSALMETQPMQTIMDSTKSKGDSESDKEYSSSDDEDGEEDYTDSNTVQHAPPTRYRVHHCTVIKHFNGTGD